MLHSFSLKIPDRRADLELAPYFTFQNGRYGFRFLFSAEIVCSENGFLIYKLQLAPGHFQPGNSPFKRYGLRRAVTRSEKSRASLVVEQLDAWAESVPIWRWNSIAKGGRIVFGTF